MTEAKSWREKEDKELRKVLAETREEIAELRGKQATGSLANTAEILRKRREVARVLTVLGEKAFMKKMAPVEEKLKNNGRSENRPSIVKNNGKKEA